VERISNVRAILFALSLLALCGLYAVFTRSYDEAAPDIRRGPSKEVQLEHQREKADGEMAAWQDESHLAPQADAAGAEVAAPADDAAPVDPAEPAEPAEQ